MDFSQSVSKQIGTTATSRRIQPFLFEGECSVNHKLQK